MAKIVIDANVIVSSLFGGNPKEVLLLALTKHSVYSSPKIKKELIELTERLKDKLGKEKYIRLNEIIESIFLLTLNVNPRYKINISRDPKDNSYLEICKEVEADYLITGDKDLLEIPKKQLTEVSLTKLKIINPKDFLLKFR